PAQAGDAGSSPAPVAKPDLVTMVLEIVHAQLDGIRLHSPERPSAPDIPVPVPERTNGGGAPSFLPAGVGKPDLSSRKIAELKEWRDDQAYRIFSPAQIANGELDAAVREKLCKEGVPPERIEFEFERCS